MRRWRWRVRRWRVRGGAARAGAAIVAVAAALLTACGGNSRSPQATMQAFAAAWSRNDWTAMSQFVDGPASDFATAGPAITADLHASSVRHTLGIVTQRGSTATAGVTSSYGLPGIGTWTVASTVNLAKRSGHWLVEWSPSVIDPAVKPGDHLDLIRTWAPRAAILGAGGAPLTVQQPIVVVGIEGSRIKDPAAVSSTLRAAGATSAEVQAAQAGAATHPTFFEPVFQMTETRFEQLGGKTGALYLIPGTVFDPTTARTAATPALTAHLVGSVGPITAQELQQLGPSYDSTSTVGQTGLEAAYQAQLAGTPGGTVTVVGGDGQTIATAVTFAPKPGTPLQTSVDPTVQQAAEAALASESHDAALVAVRASTGQVLAAVSVPAGDQFDQALAGEFPPGSTFKVVTSTALLEAGLTPSSPASCPTTLTVDGEIFHNAEGDSPVADMAQAFAESCNTAFIGLAQSNLREASLPAAAALYGIGTTPKMGLAAFGGSVPTPRDAAGLAATAIGQAQVVVAPLDLAMVAAAVDTGTVRSPRLVAGAADDATPTHPLPAAIATGLRQMMAEVVSSGTAAGTGLPAGTYAKTGTAQYGAGTPQPTDAWLIGFRGDVAFAIVVQGTGNGGPTDGPIIARFLDSLGAGN